LPPRIGRYRVTAKLGQGGFGVVYRGYDDELRRDVAIKVPHREHIHTAEDAEAYLAEARILAGLDHPHIVPVFDVGRSDDGLCYVVSKFIQGSDLAHKIAEGRLSHRDAAELTAAVAEALHHAHRRGLVHRDVKPGNMLLDGEGHAYLADFGLALKEEDYGKGRGFCGTPAYMSPEQANGEGHRVDGRSDIFSLGVVFYELLTGRRPFRGDPSAILIQIVADEPRPPRQMDDAIPKELERICLKALAKRVSERFTTARDLAEDLRHFLESGVPSAAPAISAAVATPTSAVSTSSDRRPIKIVPKGLRSFDAGDADFFLELLPGPRDRDGLPESIRFWKTRIEETNADGTFTVGLIYGPSGCGKSSLVKAGLLPRLAPSVAAVYLEATAEETEARLLKGLRRQLPDLPGDLGLVESLAAVRRGRFLPTGRKLLLVLDQFEQWLHAKRGEDNTELVQALRQCDGGRVQCVVLVRDDFWLAVSRFMQELEIRVLEGENSRLVDLFDPRHARKVLTAFGRAFGALPEQELGKDHDAFVDQAVAGLAQDGKVISVRLALFAEMVKGKPWTAATLKEVGGTAGVGVTFLEETFAASTAPPAHRLHQKAAQAVLKALLPEAGTDLKGHMRSQEELLAASGYASRPRDFDDLLRILDGELRLITPTDPEGKGEGRRMKDEKEAGPDSSFILHPSSLRYYQLTHDYLVPSLRDWLTRKQRETRRGRAELRLAGLAAQWLAFPAKRQLPTWWEWLNILAFTHKANWTPPQRKMMRRATRFHVVRGLVAAVFLALAGWGLYEGHGLLQAHALRGRLLDANTNEVPAIVADMAPYRGWVDPLLHDAYAQAAQDNDRRKQLHASLALLPVDGTQVDYLYGRLLDAEPGEVPVIRDALEPHKEALVDKLWGVVEAPEKGKEAQRLRAAAALAKYDPESEKWARAQESVANDLVAVPAVYSALWMDSLRDSRARLLPHLSAVYRDAKRRETERSLATDILADYAADQPQLLADLLMDADDKQFAVIYPKLKDRAQQSSPFLTAEIDRKLPADLPSSDAKREKLAKRQANAAVALLRLSQPEKVWPLLKHSPDPRVRSYLVHRLGPLGADAAAIIQRLEEEPDVTIRRALILSLGEYSEKDLPPDTRQALLPKVQGIYRTAADPGLHATAEWLLRIWQQEAWLKQVNDGWARDKEEREKRLTSIGQLLTRDKEKTPPQWYVNGQGQTMVVIPGPAEFVMGSPTTEKGHGEIALQHKRRIRRTFAIAAAPVTLGQFQRYHRAIFKQDYDAEERFTPTDRCPVDYTNWFQAAAYCNWLSEQEGIAAEQWCYETDEQGRVTKLKARYLSLTGYRLPTEAEMEYACRAGAVTARYYGETEELLPKYAWYFSNSQERTWPVGGKKPNDLGLFDAQGNVWTWCQENYTNYPSARDGGAVEDKEDIIIKRENSRVLRGGALFNQAANVRSAQRFDSVPATRLYSVGFRPARTFTP
jgi:serine/threonine protein kinase/formylglycine-generating enzyme required for sulfatase activity